MDDPYAVGDPDQWMEDVIKDAMRPIEPPTINPIDRLDLPAFIRNDERVNIAQINGVLNLAQARNELPTFIEVQNVNGSNVIRVEFGTDVRIVTKSPTGYHVEHPVDFELIGRKLINDD